MAIELICADTLDALPGIASQSVDAVITDPPYPQLDHVSIWWYNNSTMITSNCEICGKELVRAGSKPGRFCSKECMAIWQRSRKPVTRKWLYQKYVREGLGTTQIGRLVGRDPKRVYEWLIDWDIPTREKHQGNAAEVKPWRDAETMQSLYEHPMSVSEIADTLGIAYGTAWKWMHKLGIEMRAGSETSSLLGRNIGPGNGMYGLTGEDSPNWKGGCTPERQALYSSREWATRVQEVWRRDKAYCQQCRKSAGGKGGSDFCIHHIAGFSDYPEWRLELGNLVLLCIECHYWVHSSDNTERKFIYAES